MPQLSVLLTSEYRNTVWGSRKLEWRAYQIVKKVWWYVQPFIYNWQMDGIVMAKTLSACSKFRWAKSISFRSMCQVIDSFKRELSYFTAAGIAVL